MCIRAYICTFVLIYVYSCLYVCIRAYICAFVFIYVQCNFAWVGVLLGKSIAPTNLSIAPTNLYDILIRWYIDRACLIYMLVQGPSALTHIRILSAYIYTMHVYLRWCAARQVIRLFSSAPFRYKPLSLFQNFYLNIHTHACQGVCGVVWGDIYVHVYVNIYIGLFRMASLCVYVL